MKYIDAEKPEKKEMKFVFPKFLYARTTNNKTIDMSYAPQSLDAVEYIRSDYLQHEQPMPDSTKLIELWHEDKEMLKEKDFRNDPWRLAFNSFLCGFGRGIAVKKQEQPVVKDPFDDEQFRRGYEAGKHDAMKEQKPKIELIQRSWYMEGYNDCKYEKEPIWIISTGPDGPQYKLNPNREGGGAK